MKSFFAAVLTLLGLACTPAWAGSGRQQLEQFLSELNTLQAQFQQTVLSADGEMLQVNGVLYLQRPGRFRWDYLKPDSQTIVADGRRIWVHDKELDQVSHKSQDSALKGTPALLLTGQEPLDKHFQVQDEQRQGDLEWVDLTPKDKDTEFGSMRLAFADSVLRYMEMTDNFGQVTRFEFTEVQRNPTLDEALFRFRPPPGIDVLGD